MTTTHTDHLVTTAFCDIKYVTTTALTVVQIETTAINSLQSQLISLGIGAVVSGVFNFVKYIVSAAVLSAETANCFKLGGTQTFTSNITRANDTYTFLDQFLQHIFIYQT